MTDDLERALEKRRPFGDAIDNLGTGGSGADLVITKDGDGTRVEGQIGVEVGKGVSVGGGGFWDKAKDWAVWAGLSWRPKAR